MDLAGLLLKLDLTKRQTGLGEGSGDGLKFNQAKKFCHFLSGYLGAQDEGPPGSRCSIIQGATSLPTHVSNLQVIGIPSTH